MELDCTDMKNAIYVFAMAIGGLIEAMGMQAENQSRIMREENIAYPKEAFMKIIDDRGLHHNSILLSLNGH